MRIIALRNLQFSVILYYKREIDTPTPDYFNKKDLFYKYQFGFRKNYSTTLALIEITDNFLKSIDNGLYTCGIFLDFSKAFDTVNHEILLGKLKHYGIRGLAYRWFENYLSNRKQFV
jgi:hypothetical protein